MKKFLFAGVLTLLSFGASADGAYILTDVAAYNGYAPAGATLNNAGGTPTSGTATVTGSSFTASDVTFSFSSANASFNYSNGSWSGTLGGSSVTHSETCVNELNTDLSGPGTSCDNDTLSGLTGVWSGLANSGAASNACSASSFFAAGDCDQISIVEVEGVSLTIIEQSEFALPGTASGYIYTFTVVPVPAAVWLFGSALGLLGWARRRAA